MVVAASCYIMFNLNLYSSDLKGFLIRNIVNTCYKVTSTKGVRKLNSIPYAEACTIPSLNKIMNVSFTSKNFIVNTFYEAH